MAIIKQISQYDNGWQTPYDIGANAENVSINSINGLTAINVQNALEQMNNIITEQDVSDYFIDVPYGSIPEDGSPRPTRKTLSYTYGGLGFSSANYSGSKAIYLIDGQPTASASLPSTLLPSIPNDKISGIDTSKIISGILPVTRGGTGLSSTKGIVADLTSASTAYALSNNIGTTGILPYTKGGSGQSNIWHTSASNSSSAADIKKIITMNTTSTYTTKTGTAKTKSLSGINVTKWGPVTMIQFRFFLNGGWYGTGGNINNIDIGTLTEYYDDNGYRHYLRPAYGAVYYSSNGDNAGIISGNIGTTGNIQIGNIEKATSARTIASSITYNIYACYLSKPTVKL